MRYVQLRAFHHVAIHKSFSKAAQALFISQPAVSDQVSSLEKYYDIKLFDRKNRNIMLTEQGKKLLDVTHRFFEVEGLAYALLSEAREQGDQKLSIFVDSVRHIDTVLARYRERYPDIHISFQSRNTEEVLDHLIAHKADIGVMSLRPSENQFTAISLKSTRIIVLMSKNAPLIQGSSVSFRKLADLPLIMRKKGSHTRMMVEHAAGKQGITFKPLIEAEDRESMCDLVSAGVGVGFVSEAEYPSSPSFRAVMIEGKEIKMEEFIICLKQRQEVKTIKYFMEIARNILAI